ncbi:glycoside hydrolase family 18 chitinase [Streptomyces avicenniae]|uniref:glycoside hydrolase family 18 chitinase n=1 Tax=Streptomyces avicenniae TaxID=500153 RepID=UPI00069AF925|nr:glycoside hydrolase family 18 chitinase [Streptomyces avicenniae]
MRFRHRVAAAMTTLLLPLAGLVGLASPAQAAASATATYTKVSDWGSGFEGRWTVRNTGTTTLTSWTVEWDYPSGTTVGSFWDADLTRSGQHWTARNKSWNGTLAPGASVSFGFNGSGSGAPGNCRLNGASCDGSTQPGDRAPSAPGTPTASNVTNSSVTLSWTAATDDRGIKNYDVLRNGSTVGTVTGTTFTNSGLTADTAYSYTVRARDTADQVGPASGAVSVRTTGGGGGPGDPGGPGGDKINLGYFTEWSVYGRNYHVNNLITSGSASQITHINYAFGNVRNGECVVDDTYAAYERAYTAAESVSGVADTWDQPLRGNFNQLRQLKAEYPHIKVLYSFGGWTYSGGFTEAARNPAAFADSCREVVEDPRWADVFDGIDIDWEYPNSCGLTCDASGPAAFRNLSQALRAEFGPDYLVTAAITGDGSTGGKIDAADYGGAAQYLDWYNVMTYDYFGAFAPTGPTAPHSPLTSYNGLPTQGFTSEAAINKLRAQGVPSSKLLLGIGFYGRGWTGVTQSAPGGSATGAAPGTYEAGIEDYKVLRNSCPVTGTVAGTAYAHCGNQWWSYDTPATITTKMNWANQQGLGGAFFWEFSGDTANGELVRAIGNGLN